MQSITPSITPARPYASWLRRVASNVLDSALLLAYIPAQLVGHYWSLFCALFILKGAFYVINKRTLGRTVTRTVVASEQTGEALTNSRLVLRSLAHAFDVMPFFAGFLIPLWDKKRQTLADKVMGTVVVVVPKGATITELKRPIGAPDTSYPAAS